MPTPRVVASHHVALNAGETENSGEPGHSGSPGVHERFPIASVTKTLTALLAARLAVDGILSWDDPIAPTTDLTLRGLLTHTTGVPFELDPGHWNATAPTVHDLDAALRDPPRLGLPPGTWHYSNFGYGLVGRVLERATDAPYAELLTRHVLAPLGMSSTSYPAPHEAAPLLGAAGPAGDLWSTMADLVILGGALAGARPEVVTTSVLAMLFESAVPSADGRELGPGIRSQLVGFSRVVAATGTISDRTTCLAVWPRRGVSVLVAEVGYDHDSLVDAALQRWRRADRQVGSWWWDGHEVIDVRCGDDVELRMRETRWPFALFTGRAVAGALVGVDARGAPMQLSVRGDSLVGPQMVLTQRVGDSAYRNPALP